MASLPTVKRVAARLLGVGRTRVRILDAKRAAEALTSEDVRGLIKQELIIKLPSRGVGRGKARSRAIRKKAGRGRGQGSARGTPYAVLSAKKRWIRRVRALRRLLRKLKPRLKKGAYKRLFRMIKGAGFRDKRQLLEFVKSNSLWSEKKK